MGRDDESEDEIIELDVSGRWAGSSYDPSFARLYRNGIEENPDWDEKVSEESSLGDSSWYSDSSFEVLQEGWELQGGWNNDETREEDRPRRNQGEDKKGSKRVRHC